MVKKAKKKVVVKKEVVDEGGVTNSEKKDINSPMPEPNVDESFVPEKVDGIDGAVRDEKKETPMDLMKDDEGEPRKEGNWKVVNEKELAKLENDGLLIGYDPITREALIKGA